MSLRVPKSFGVALVSVLLGYSSAHGALLFLYDFPNDPGSGLAVDQATPQPPSATFSDFTRTNVTAAGGPLYTSGGWSTGAIDTTEYVSFTITAAPAFALDLTSLTFDVKRASNGPLDGMVALFLNGSATAYATFSFSPTTTMAGQTFDFVDLTDFDSVTTATFRFYGWNSPNNNGGFSFDNVATNGTIAAVPEGSMGWPAIFLILSATLWEHRRRHRGAVKRAGRGPN